MVVERMGGQYYATLNGLVGEGRTHAEAIANCFKEVLEWQEFTRMYA